MRTRVISIPIDFRFLLLQESLDGSTTEGWGTSFTGVGIGCVTGDLRLGVPSGVSLAPVPLGAVCPHPPRLLPNPPLPPLPSLKPPRPQLEPPPGYGFDAGCGG